jgi:integrase
MKKRADGRYVRTITDPRTKTRVSFYGYSPKEVNQKILKYESKSSNKCPFEDVAEEWWDIEVEQLSPSTVKGYKCATDRVKKEWKGLNIADILPSDINRFLLDLAKKGYAKKTVKNHKIIINRIFHFATVEGYIKNNPARDSELPRNLKETKRLPATVSEEEIIKESADIWFLPYLALSTGMRKGELLGLRWGDVDMASGIIYVRRSVYFAPQPTIKAPKTEAGIRKIPIIGQLKEELQKRKGNDKHYVFGGESPMTDKAYRHAYKMYQKKTGITATAHQLRKSYATMAVDANVPPDVLKTIIGHRDISTTMNIYAEVRDYRISEAKKLIESRFSEQQKK